MLAEAAAMREKQEEELKGYTDFQKGFLDKGAGVKYVPKYDATAGIQ